MVRFIFGLLILNSVISNVCLAKDFGRFETSIKIFAEVFRTDFASKNQILEFEIDSKIRRHSMFAKPGKSVNKIFVGPKVLENPDMTEGIFLLLPAMSWGTLLVARLSLSPTI